MAALSLPLLFVVASLVLYLVIRGDPFHLLVLAVAAAVVSGHWQLAGVIFDVTDVALLGLFVTLLARTRSWLPMLLEQLPNRRIWLLLILLSAVSYLLAPAHQRYLIDPIRVSYQLYRYAFRELLFLPLVVLFVPDRRHLTRLLAWFVVIADISALISIHAGYQGWRSGGLFVSNAVGSAYALPFLACFAGLVLSDRGLPRILLTCNLLLLLRGLLFSGSRGSFVTILVATCVFGGGLLVWSGSRSRALRLSLVALLGLMALVIVKPDVGTRPTIRRFSTIGNPLEQKTLRWRMEERWPYFWQLVLERPWLGHGTSQAPELGRATTPHNGYLALAVDRGLPFLAGMLLLGLIGIRRAFASFRSASEASTRLLSLMLIAAIFALLVHNLVESTFAEPFVSRSYWVCIALAHALDRQRLRQAPTALDFSRVEAAA